MEGFVEQVWFCLRFFAKFVILFIRKFYHKINPSPNLPQGRNDVEHVLKNIKAHNYKKIVEIKSPLSKAFKLKSFYIKLTI